jgi:uncharacterized membrane protein YoaK (UPF0700 family)
MEKYDLLAEKLKTALLLATVGGFLDAYSYIGRGGVFANAETGNMVLFGISLINRSYIQALHYFIPILSYFIGIQVVDLIRRRYFHIKNESRRPMIFWRQGILLVEIVVLTLVGFLPALSFDSLANVLIAFVCALQVQAFKKIHGLAFASTMCTGNLIKSSSAVSMYFETKEMQYLVNASKYILVIVCFILGALLGSILTSIFYTKSVFFCSLALLYIMLDMGFRNMKSNI